MMWVLFVSWVPNLRAGCLCAQTTKICTLAGEQPEKTCSRYMAQLVKNPPAMWETWVGKIPWRREQLPTLQFWSGEFHGLYSPWGPKELDTTQQLSLSVPKMNSQDKESNIRSTSQVLLVSHSKVQPNEHWSVRIQTQTYLRGWLKQQVYRVCLAIFCLFSTSSL